MGILHVKPYVKENSEFNMSKGLLIVFTGNGKGETTAALGMALRAAGHGMRTLILQFIKGTWPYGELEAIERLEEITICPLGTGFTWKKENLDEDRQLAISGWQRGAAEIRNARYDMIILDELNVVFSYNLLHVDEVLPVLQTRPPKLHVVLTGRNAPPEIIQAADLVTEMRQIKHPYHDSGIRAQKGVEY